MRARYGQEGFTLPTVVITSVVMIALLALAMQLLTGASRSLRSISPPTISYVGRDENGELGYNPTNIEQRRSDKAQMYSHTNM